MTVYSKVTVKIRMSRFAFARRDFQNKTTDWITENPNATVEQLLCDDPSSLSVAVRNEAKILLDFMDSPCTEEGYKDLKRIEVMGIWALTLDLNSKAVMEKWKIYQINRNASTILSAASRKIQEMIRSSTFLRKQLENFISPENSKYNLDPLLAGHFQRIFEAFMRSSERGALKLDVDIRSIVAFCIEHVDISAYQQLLLHLGTDFKDVLEDYSFHEFVSDILKGAAKMCLAIDALADKNSAMEARRQYLTQTMRKARQEGSRGPVRQIDTSKEVDPPDLSARLSKVYNGRERTPEFERRTRERAELVGYNEMMEIERNDGVMRAYMLLSSVCQMITEECDTIIDLRNEDHVRYLLICGVYSDSVFGVCQLAFKLLKNILQGNRERWDVYYADQNALDPTVETLVDEWTDMSPEIRTLIDTYAEDFVFAERVTDTMIAAFPIFWNHRYTNIEHDFEYPPVRKIVYLSESGVKPEDMGEYKRPAGITPFELYGRFLLDEPPISDILNLEILKVFKRCINMAHEKRISEPERHETREFHMEVFDVDIILYNFWTTKFYYNAQYPNVDLSVIPLIQSANAFDPFWQKDKTKRRVALNGIIPELAAIMSASDIYTIDNVPTCLFEQVSMFDEIDREYPARMLEYEAIKKKFDPSDAASKSITAAVWKVDDDDKLGMQPGDLRSVKDEDRAFNSSRLMKSKPKRNPGANRVPLVRRVPSSAPF